MPLENEWGRVAELEATKAVRKPFQVSRKGPGHLSSWTVGPWRAGSWPCQDLAHGETQGTRPQGAMSQHPSQ